MKRKSLSVIVLILVVAAFAQAASAQESVPSCEVGSTCESGMFGLTAEQIATYPTPNVTMRTADLDLIYDRIYRRATGALEIYDAPNGSYVETLDAGFNFVTIEATQEGWSQIAENKWVRTEQLNEDVALSRFAGIHLPAEPLPYTVGWLLVHLRPSVTPGGEPSNDNPLLYRYTVVSIYATVEVDGWRWYQIGVNQWINQRQVAKVLPIERPEGADTARWISIDLYEQVLIAYEGERPVFATLTASGMADWSTNEGLFHVYIRYPRSPMSGAEGQPDFYYLQEVPWTMYYDNDIAIHGAYWHDGFGFRRSHGCVNVSITDAHFLYNWSSEEFDFNIPEDTGPAVYVYSSGVYR